MLSRKLVTLLIVCMFAATMPAWAGGPRYVAGSTYFDASVVGQPLTWTGGKVAYSVDQGALNAENDNAQAVAMVDAAAALWNAVPTAALQLTNAGALAEDVSGANAVAETGVFLQPADVTPQATGTPLAVIFDQDGSIIDTLMGTGASEPTNCSRNGVYAWFDNVTPEAGIVHGVLLLNGLCATTPALESMMSYQIARGFGLLLNLGYSQVNPDALTEAASEPTAAQAWGVMSPTSGVCGAAGGTCVPEMGQLSLDDEAAISRLYPVTAENMSGFSGKVVTAANTINISGTVEFAEGVGMQGVNVVLRPLDSSGNPLYQYTVTAVTGAEFSGNHGNPVLGYADASGEQPNNGLALSNYGGTDTALQGAFDLSAVPLPPGLTAASYQLSFEAMDADYILTEAVGPYVAGTPEPSGELPTITLPGLSAGSVQALTVTAAGSATANASTAIGAEGVPAALPASGEWRGVLSAVGQTDWLSFPVRANRLFTIVAQALDEAGSPTDRKALPVLGVWDLFLSPTVLPVAMAEAQNGTAKGETWLQVASSGVDTVRLGVADQRGDGRPDYAYQGWVLYADTVSPERLPGTGGPITIRGVGFHASDTVTVAGQAATITAITPNEIDAIAPAAATGFSGSADVTVADAPGYNAIATIPSGVSYDAATGDGLTIVTAPMGSVAIETPQPFTVLVRGTDGLPAGGITVTWTVTSGTAVLGCGQAACSVAATGDGHATMNVTATTTQLAAVTVSLSNGASLLAEFTGAAAATLTPLTPSLSLAAGATVAWPVSVLDLANNLPAAGNAILWSSVSGMSAPLTASTTDATGVAAASLTVGPLTEGQSVSSAACINGVVSSRCASFSVFGARPEYATLAAVSNVQQVMASSENPAAVTLRVLDMDGNPMAGGTVNVYEALYAWAPPCTGTGRCAAQQLLSKQVVTLTSGIDGAVAFVPISMAGVATNLEGIATVGNAGTAVFTVEEHP